MRRVAVGGVLLLLAACGQHSEQQSAGNQEGSSPKLAAETASANSAANAAADNETGTLPAAGAAMRFVGTWAKSKADCASNPWRFTEKGLNVAGGPQCSFYNVAKGPGGYDIGAQCPTKQPIHTDLIKLRFAESAGAMLVESNAISPTGLIYCGK